MNVKDYRHATADDLLKQRIIMIEGELSEETMVLINCALLRLDNESNDEIVLYFRSGGGNAQYGLANYEVLSSLRSPTRGVVVKADSAASMILMGCKKRQIFPSGSIIIHSVRCMDLRSIPLNEEFDERIRAIKKWGMALNERAMEIYLARTKMKADQLRKEIHLGDKFELPILSKRALKLGLVDEILSVDGFKKDGFIFP